MRLLLLGLGAIALFATEPGKALQRKLSEGFKDLKCRFRGEEADGAEKAEKAEKADESELESSRDAMKDSNERHPEMGSEENEEDAKHLDGKFEERSSEETGETEEASEADESEEPRGDSGEEHGVDERIAKKLAEKLNAKPSAPEDELKSA